MRVLSLDLGTKSLGSCVSDEMNLIAMPIENFMFDNEDYNLAFNRVSELVAKYNVKTIVLGYPKNGDGTRSFMTQVVEDFKEIIEKHLTNVNVKLIDERFTTKRGMKLLENKYKGDKEKIKEYKDMAAAYVMLSDYLSTL